MTEVRVGQIDAKYSNKHLAQRLTYLSEKLNVEIAIKSVSGIANYTGQVWLIRVN